MQDAGLSRQSYSYGLLHNTRRPRMVMALRDGCAANTGMHYAAFLRMARKNRLKTYRDKRDFRRTSEPRGGHVAQGADRRFVVQKHAASRLHYDFRLELDGVLLSWAVPKGPSLNPRDRRLAVHVEDHPVEYGDFEGIIPEGEYGGGTVMLWDRGIWESQSDPRESYENGHLKFRLKGNRLKGGWSLIRQSNDEKHWLLIKRKDSHAQADNRRDSDHTSVATGRTMEAIAAAQDQVWSGDRSTADARQHQIDPAALTRARKARMPKTLEPEKATLANAVPVTPDWLHELKFDGYRILAFIHNGKIHLRTRNSNDWTNKLPTVRDALKELHVNSAVFDGEVVAFSDDGSASFQALQSAIGNTARQENLAYYLFDLPYLDGYDLTGTPLRERKKALAELLKPRAGANLLRFSDHVEGNGDSFFDFACRSAQEGVISKRAASPYTQKRTRDWIKVKCVRRQEFVVGGYTDPGGSRTGFGALLLGVYDGRQLRYCGKVGTGFTDDDLNRLSTQLQKRERRTSPFAAPPHGKHVHWTTPTLVAEVAFTEWTDDGHLRHPSFQGLRKDKPAKSIHREEPIPSVNVDSAVASHSKSRESRRGDRTENSVDIAGINLSHPDRVLYPEVNLTKCDLAQYYESVADWCLPYIVDRPLMVRRCPKGWGKECFYQKHVNESPPDAVKSTPITEKRSKKNYLYIDDVQGLIALVQLGSLEFHPWGSRVGKLESPDRLIFDVDPGDGVEWPRIVQAGRRLRDLLKTLRLTSFVTTTGGKGLHVVSPLSGKSTWDSLKAFSRAVAREMADAYPDDYVATMTKRSRRGKIYIDYLRNARGATAIAPYSTRARRGAPVATPLRWDELAPSMKRDHHNAQGLPRRVASLKADPWAEYHDVQQTLTKTALRAMGVAP